MQTCFSSIGCPDYTLEEIADLALKFDIPLLELRSVSRSMDLPRLFAETEGGWPGAAELLKAKNLQVRVLGTSFRLIGGGEEAWKALLDFGALAECLEVPYLRAFGGGDWGTPHSAEEMREAAENVLRWNEERATRGWKAELLLETHDGFSGCGPCLRLMEELGRPVNLLWDAHHTWRIGGEAPEDTWRKLGAHVRHVHTKDSALRPGTKDFDYVLPGMGEMPEKEVEALLERDGYSGAVSLEWEKLWHPELAPLTEALAAWRGRPGH